MAVPAEATITPKQRNPILRGLFFVLGLLCLGLIPISTTLPVLPTFDLILLAAFFFSMSSERMYNWMLNHPWFGKVIRGYRDYGLTLRMKWIAIISITLSVGISGVFLTTNVWVRAALAVIGIWGIWFVSTRPTRDPSTVD